MHYDAASRISPRRRPVASRVENDFGALSSYIDHQFKNLDGGYGVRPASPISRSGGMSLPSQKYFSGVSLGNTVVSLKGKGDFEEADYLSPRGQFNDQILEERSATVPLSPHFSPVRVPELDNFTEATPAVRVFEGYLNGPNICGSPIEMTVADAKEFAFNNPIVKAFCFQRPNPSGLTWVYFKPRYDFCPASGWTAVHVLTHSLGMKAPIVSQPTMEPVRHFGNSSTPLFRDRLLRFYHFYCPEKLSNAINTLNEYRGMEESLFKSLVRMYGPEPRTPGLDENLPGGWICVENRTGHVFYVHTETGRKQWQKPNSRMVEIVPSEISRSPIRKQPSVALDSLNKAILVTLSGGHTLQTRFSALLGDFGYRQQVALSEKVVGSTPTYHNLRLAFDWLCRDAKSESKLIVYYCGSVTENGLLTSDDKVIKLQQLSEIFSGISRQTQLLLFLDVAPGGTVVDLQYQNVCNSRGTKTQQLPAPHTLNPCTTVITTTDGFPPIGALTTGFCNVIRSSPRNIFFRTLLSEIRSDSLAGMQCSISLCTNRDANCFSFKNFSGHQVQEYKSPEPIDRSKSDFGFTEKDKQDILGMAASDTPPILRAMTPLRAGSPRGLSLSPRHLVVDSSPQNSPHGSPRTTLRERLSPFRPGSPEALSAVRDTTLPPDRIIYSPPTPRRFVPLPNTPSMSPDRRKKTEHLQQLQEVVSTLESGGQRADDVLREVLDLLNTK